MVMTLDEAIEHAKEKGKGDDECAAEHRNLAGFLEELREYRQTKVVLCIGEKAAEVGSLRLMREHEPHTVLTGKFKPEGIIRVQEDAVRHVTPIEPCLHRTHIWKDVRNTCCFCDNEAILAIAQKAPERESNTIVDNKLLIPAKLKGAVVTCKGCLLRKEPPASEEPAKCFYRSYEVETMEYRDFKPGRRTLGPGRRIIKCSHPEVLKLADADPSGNWKGIQSAFPPRSVQIPFATIDRTIQCEGCSYCTDTPLPRV